MTDFFADRDHLILFRDLADAVDADAVVLTYDSLDRLLYLYDTDKRVEIWRAHEKKTDKIGASYYRGTLTAIVYNRVAMQSIAFTLGDARERTGFIIAEPEHLAALKHGYRDPDDLADAIALKIATAFREFLGGDKAK